MAFCDFHPQRIALEKCDHCQAPICDECKNILKGKYYCPTCSSRPIPGVTLVPYREPWKAALLSLLVPGGGQVYNGQLLKGVSIFLLCWLILPWLYGVYDAFVTAKRINAFCVFTNPTYKDTVAFLLIAALILLVVGQNWRNETSEGHLQKMARKDLLTISRAVEKYKKENAKYPENYSQLYFHQPPYVEEILCDVEHYGYHYTCDFTENGYVLTATPVEKSNYDRNPVIKMTGGLLSPER